MGVENRGSFFTPQKNDSAGTAFQQCDSAGAAPTKQVIQQEPSPQSDSRPFVLGLRRALRQGEYPYILLCSHQADADACTKSGANDFLTKPLDTKLLRHRIDNVARYSELSSYLSDLEVDYPSKDGVIAKSAIYQLFLAAIDRADRYGEKVFVVFSRFLLVAALVLTIGNG